MTAIRSGISEKHGRLLEGVIFCELKRRENKIVNFKTESGLEIDFMFWNHKDQVTLIQVCAELSIENLEREMKPFVECRSDKRFKKAKYIFISAREIDPRLNLPTFVKAMTAWDFLTSKPAREID